MDLTAYSRVLRTHWYVVVGGVVLAILLAVLSYYRVSADGGLTPRKAELWQSEGTLFLTERGFPAGRRTVPFVQQQVGSQVVAVPAYNDPYKYANLASLYARLATGDPVQQRILADGGPLPGTYNVAAVADTSFGREVSLPALSVFGKATTAGAAEETTNRVMRAFVAYIERQQRDAGIAAKNRVVLQVLNQPEPAVLIQGRKKTLPIAVFLAVLFASIAFAFVLDNVQRAKAEAEVARQAPVSEVPPPNETAAREETARAPAPATLPARRRAPGSTLR